MAVVLFLAGLIDSRYRRQSLSMRIETSNFCCSESLVKSIECFHSNIRKQQKHIPPINALGKQIN